MVTVLAPRLELFNDAKFGPYHGQILDVAVPEGYPPRPGVKWVGFGETAGIYFRWIRWPNGRLVWTLALSLMYPLLASAVIPFIWLARRYRRTPRGFPIELSAKNQADDLQSR